MADEGSSLDSTKSNEGSPTSKIVQIIKISGRPEVGVYIQLVCLCENGELWVFRNSGGRRWSRLTYIDEIDYE